MKKRLVIFLMLLAVMGVMMNCASIITGTIQSVDFSSQPSGAKIFIDGKDYGKTPSLVDLRRKGRFKGEPSSKKEYIVKIELDGYYPYEIVIKREVNAWILSNLLMGGGVLVGIIIDASTGAMYKLTPDQVSAYMGKTSAMKSYTSDDTIYVAIDLNIDPSWERVGAMTKGK